jgi:DNA mismatch repair protein MutS
MDASSPDNATEPLEGDVTPMMAQFLAAKRAAGDALVFFRMGDFYELFFDDAVKAAAAIDITLTRRGRHKGEDIPMCGVPAHSHESYLARLIRKGFRVAICEQVEPPDAAKKRGAKSVMRREIVRFVTPGTLTEDTLLEARRHNFLGALSLLRGGAEAALAWTDVSTGEIFVRPTDAAAFRADAAQIGFAELIAPDHPFSDEWAEAIDADDRRTTRQPAALFDSRVGERRLKDIFAVAALDGFGAFGRAELAALGALIAYVKLTQAGAIPALRPPRRAVREAAMTIDAATRASLELVEAQTGGRDGSLLAAIDRTVTGPGARALAGRLSAPLTDPEAIAARLDAVEAFVGDDRLRTDLRAALKAAPDMIRSLNRLSLRRGGPRDLAAIRDGLAAARAVGELLDAAPSLAPLPPPIAEARRAFRASADLGALEARLAAVLSEALPLLARDGDFIADGADEALDAARALKRDARAVIGALETELKSRTDIRTLKIKHNNQLGYFIEVPSKDADRLGEEPFRREFIRRQGLAGASRFSTPDLSDLDARIARAGEEALARELELFAALERACLAASSSLCEAADALAALDVAAALAELAKERNYVRPRIDASRAFEIRGGRHPVVEQALGGGAKFTPNDGVLAEGDEPRLHLVTGPNMAGKSTYLRQNAVIAILSQMGSFAPASFVHIGAIDRVFSRVGASDDLARGRSTFMVEMVETAAILNQATDRSLVILDEIGRGTSTFDGLAIAWAAAEHLHDVNRCRGLFATHYHELTALAAQRPRIANVSMRVREWNGEVIFLHEVAEGAADRSYGVAVARLAGLPRSAVKRAEALLAAFEAERGALRPLTDLPLFAASAPTATNEGESKSVSRPSALADALAVLDPDALSPREALDALYRLKALAERA